MPFSEPFLQYRMKAITDSIEKTKQEVGPTLGKVIVSTKEYKSFISEGSAFVAGSQLVHYKSSGFSRAMAAAQGQLENVGHFFGSFFGGSGEETTSKANEQEAAAAVDPAYELKAERVRFCYKFEKTSDVCDWKVSHMHMDLEDEDTIKNCDVCCAACKAAS